MDELEIRALVSDMTKSLRAQLEELEEESDGNPAGTGGSRFEEVDETTPKEQASPEDEDDDDDDIIDGPRARDSVNLAITPRTLKVLY